MNEHVHVVYDVNGTTQNKHLIGEVSEIQILDTKVGVVNFKTFGVDERGLKYKVFLAGWCYSISRHPVE